MSQTTPPPLRVLEYNKVAPLRGRVDPRLRFISRLSLLLGVPFVPLGFLAAVGGLWGTAVTLMDGELDAFWIALSVSGGVSVTASILLLVCAAHSRRARFRAVWIGAVALCVALVVGAATILINASVTGKYDFAFVSLILLTGVAACVVLLTACRRFERETTTPMM